MGWKKDAKPLEPSLLVRHVGCFLLGRPELHGLLESDLCVGNFGRSDGALRLFALVLHKALLRPEVLQTWSADVRILETRGCVAALDMLPESRTAAVSS